MLTDIPPRELGERDEYARSEAMVSIDLPPAAPLRKLASELEAAMKSENRKEIQRACNAIAARVSEHFGVAPPAVRILGARPLEENGDVVDETFGDYDIPTGKIRLWMRTAVLEQVTTFGTLLSTLAHEICHHLDIVYFDFPNTFHTRGFYERSGLLYHHIRGTPVRKLVWDRLRSGSYRINWPQTMRGGKARTFSIALFLAASSMSGLALTATADQPAPSLLSRPASILIASAKTQRFVEKEGFEREKKDILNTLKDNVTNRFTSLLEAYKDTFSMDAMLKEPGPYTLFAPDDSAFRHFPQDDWSRIYANKPELKQLLLYHMVSGKVDSNELRAMKSIKTLDGRELPITTTGGNLYVGKSLVITTDVPCTNGTIHVLERVNIPPAQP